MKAFPHAREQNLILRFIGCIASGIVTLPHFAQGRGTGGFSLGNLKSRRDHAGSAPLFFPRFFLRFGGSCVAMSFSLDGWVAGSTDKLSMKTLFSVCFGACERGSSAAVTFCVEAVHMRQRNGNESRVTGVPSLEFCQLLFTACTVSRIDDAIK